ncbi:DNA cytosine methyltransferase [Virgibacillus halodenitrificans]|uniref:DNA cytosine methyltransferase n=1 Tax=Virgibacillus halodenitrificans TaxID=1482 RepID=UPI000EF49F91|nr:DNA cytosine methyltransferase [Virgibacillus halodenitrificans]
MSLKNIVMKKVYQVSHKGKKPKPRFFLQHLICEAAGWNPGETLYVQINYEDREVTVQKQSFQTEKNMHKVSVSYRENKSSGIKRPLVDTAGERYNSIVRINEKVEILVYKGKVVIRPLHYKLMENVTVPSHSEERIRLTSICAGAGIGTSVFVNSGYFTPVMEIEWEEDSAEVLKQNFPNSCLFNGDIRNCYEVMESDVVLATLPCNEHSNLGWGDEGMVNNLVLAAAKLIESSKAKAVIFENVPQWYKSKSYQTLKGLLQSTFPYWMEKNMESLDYGSLARRNRTYAIAATDKELFLNFEFPTAPKSLKRRKLRNYVDSFKEENYEWKSLKRWSDSFATRGAWKGRNLDKTFVSLDVKEIQCIPKRYRSHCASNSYVLNGNKDKWRFLTISEIKKILSIPDWFEFSPHTTFSRQFEMLGQGVDGRILSSIANNLTAAFMKARKSLSQHTQVIKESVQEAITIDEYGQIELPL